MREGERESAITFAFVSLWELFLKAFQPSDVDARIYPLPLSVLHI